MTLLDKIHEERLNRAVMTHFRPGLRPAELKERMARRIPKVLARSP
jgi:hypothetical protein